MAYSGPRIKLRGNVRIPARVVSGPGISQVIADGTLTTGLDLESLDSAGTISDPSQFRIFIYNDATDEWEFTTLDNVPTTTTGDGRTGRGDADYTVLNLDRYIALTAALTAPRTWTLPAANSVPAGTRIALQDEAGGITGTNTLTVGVTGADTINGATTFVLLTARSGVEFRSDGTSKWSTRDIAVGSDGHVLRRSGSTLAFGQVATGGIADAAATNAKLANMANGTVKGRATAATGVPEDITGAQFRDSVQAAGAAIDHAYAEYTTKASLTSVIPLDATIPQVGEGTQILSAAITPKSTTNKITVRVTVMGGTSATDNVVVALFRNGGANALRAVAQTTPANHTHSIVLVFEDVPASTSAQTYTVRVGPGTAVTAYLNWNGVTANMLGATGIACTLTLDEFKA